MKPLFFASSSCADIMLAASKSLFLTFPMLVIMAVASPLHAQDSGSGDTQTSQPVPPTQPAGPTAADSSLMGRDTLTGDWYGLRSQLAAKGFTPSLIYEAEVFGNWGGARQGAISDGLFTPALDIDLEKATGFWKDAAFHVNAYETYGPALSEHYVGDFSNTSNISGYNTFRLQELWLQQNFWQKRASIRAGLLGADSEFFAAQASSIFINSTFGAFDLFVPNFTDAPAFPVANPAIRLDAAPVPAFDFKAAVFGMSASSDQDGNDRHGTYFDIDDGAMLAFEGAFLLNQGPDDHGLAGSYKIGGFIHRGDYKTWHSQAEAALGRGPLSGNGTNYAVYGVIDQVLFKNGDRTIEIFGRGGVAPSRYSFVDAYFDTGFNFTGFIPSRAGDTAGVAIARAAVSGDFSDAQQLEGNPPSTAETVIEATYKIGLSKWWNIQPDLQYIVNPSGVVGSRNAFVLGVRTTITF